LTGESLTYRNRPRRKTYKGAFYAPFSHLDLISCRNVLIYFGLVLQQKVISIFHFALKPAGFLLLGKSEALGASTDLFSPLDRRYKLYANKT
jgi:two-component system CheB/CheR fusion protein